MSHFYEVQQGIGKSQNSRQCESTSYRRESFAYIRTDFQNSQANSFCKSQEFFFFSLIFTY